MHALQPGAAGEAWKALGAAPGQAARDPDRVGALGDRPADAHRNAKPQTIHDFYNFPEPLYRLRYPAPGAPEIAQRAQALLKEAGLGAAIDGSRGLDHGAWAPLLYMYPEADVPVVQISVQPALGPRHHVAVGNSLRNLSGEGVLHDRIRPHDAQPARLGARPRATPEPYAREFQAWVFDKLKQHDVEDLIEYRARSPHGVRAHPTDEHFLPLFFALGAAPERATPERVYDAIDSGVLAMDAYVFN